MRFAVIGDSAEAILLVEEVHRSLSHQLVACCVEGALAATITDRHIPVSIVPSAEEAILDPEADAIIVAVHDVDQSVHLVRRASQEGRYVVAVPPDQVSTAYSFELHLLLDDAEKGIVPLTGRWYVGFDDNGPLPNAEVRQLSLALPLSTEDAVQRRRQLQAIDAMCGTGLQFSRITGLDLPAADGTLLTRTVTLAAAQLENANVPPATILFDHEEHSACELTVTALDGKKILIPAAFPDGITPSASGGERMLQRLISQLGDKQRCQSGMEEFSNTLELNEGLQKSLHRRRTVDVYFDGVSERAVFKTQMTAIGCGVLAYVSFGMIVYLITAQLLDLPPVVLRIGRIVWIAPLVLFLLAQLLLPITKQRTSGTPPDSSSKELP